ncbi:MAG: DPP IV N-terminal domain-containing protein [Myxococcota bacterium]
MRTLTFLALVVASLGCGSTPTTSTTPPVEPAVVESAADPAFIEQYSATYSFRLGHPSSIRIGDGGQEILFLRSGPRSFVRNLYAFSVETGAEREILTAEQILQGGAEELSPEERARRERMRLSARGIASFEVSRDGTKLLVPLSGKLFVVQREGNEVHEVGTEEGYANDPRFSPDGTKIACVRNGELHVIELESNRERRLTRTANDHITNGLAEFVAQEEMGRYRGFWWSPDSETLLYQETNTEGMERLNIVDPREPEAVSSSPYPRPGKANAAVRLGVISAQGGTTRWLDWDRDALPYVAAVRWAGDGPLTLVVQDRNQQLEQVRVVDPTNGQTEVIHEERDAAWINLYDRVPRWLRGGERFLWITERNGWPQLELRSRSGESRMLTEPDLGLQGLEHVDEDAGVAYVAAAPEPIDRQLYRVRLDPEGTRATPLTHTPGYHTAVFGEGLEVRTSYTEMGRTDVVLRGGETLGSLRSEAEEPPFEPQVEFVTVGSRDYRASVVRPRNFDSSRRYPVLVSVYGGPLHQHVRRLPRRYLIQQWYADHGYIVVSADGRGTPGRGREWERTIARDVITEPLLDQVEALTALGERFPEMDMSRVGIWGWSFGGYFSAMAVMQRPDVFHAGIAGAPVADWRDYDTHYTERYLGLPEQNPEGYAHTSVLTHAPNLTRPLLIVHGTSDDNVYFTHAVKMSDALLRAGRSHEFLPLSGFTHMVSEPEVSRHLQERFIGFFAQHLRRRDP